MGIKLARGIISKTCTVTHHLSKSMDLVFQAGNIRSAKLFYCVGFIQGANFSASVKFQVKEIIKPKNIKK